MKCHDSHIPDEDDMFSFHPNQKWFPHPPHLRAFLAEITVTPTIIMSLPKILVTKMLELETWSITVSLIHGFCKDLKLE